MAKGAIMNVLMGQMLPEIAANDPKFAQLFKTKSMNECSNRLFEALALLASEERNGEKSVMADFGADDIIPIARAFYEKDASAKDMLQMFKDAIVERKKIEDKKPAKPAKTPKTPAPTAPATPKPTAKPTPKPAPAPAPQEEDDDDNEWL